MRNLRLLITYVGTRFAGWQVQRGQPTIQGTLEDILGRMLQTEVRLAGAGRTDAGVHARGQVANFMTTSRIPGEGLLRGANARLPDDIRIIAVDEATASFHARADARGKEYRYRLFGGAVMSPFEAPFALAVRGGLRVDEMRRAAARFVGTHDFTSFAASACRVADRTRTIALSEIETHGEFVEYRVRGDGFLQHMVRNMVGTLIEVGRGRRPPEVIASVLRARDRRAAGPCAPSRGLVLERVFYEEGV